MISLERTARSFRALVDAVRKVAPEFGVTDLSAASLDVLPRLARIRVEVEPVDALPCGQVLSPDWGPLESLEVLLRIPQRSEAADVFGRVHAAGIVLAEGDATTAAALGVLAVLHVGTVGDEAVQCERMTAIGEGGGWMPGTLPAAVEVAELHLARKRQVREAERARELSVVLAGARLEADRTLPAEPAGQALLEGAGRAPAGAAVPVRTLQARARGLRQRRRESKRRFAPRGAKWSTMWMSPL